MAGTLPIVLRNEPETEKQQLSLAKGKDQWEIQFSRFFSYPSLSSTCPHLLPISPSIRRRPPQGVWLSSSCPVCLQLYGLSGPDAVLTIRSGETVFEEHFVSKLLYSWPQMSCIPELPARGSRSVFICYKECAGDIQKFGVRFSTLYEAETFMNTIKGILDRAMDLDLSTEISLPSDFMSSNKLPCRAEDSTIVTPIASYAPKIPEGSDRGFQEELHTQNATSTRVIEDAIAALPPSFTSLLSNCCSAAEQGATEAVLPRDVDLKSQIVKYMEDSSFQDMLLKVEKIIGDMGYNIAL